MGQSLTLTIVRDGAKKEVKVDVAKAKEEQTAQGATPRLEGATFTNARSGVRVAELAPESSAYRAGLRKDDIITAVNRKPVKTVEQLEEELANSSRQTALFILRDGQEIIIIV